MINHENLQTLVQQLYATVNQLEKMFPGRRFTPDGHLVGSLGECLVADAYGLQLERSSNKGYDALTADGEQVEIKATQAKSVAFRSEPQRTIVIKLARDGSFEEIYNGPGAIVWAQFKGRPPPSNGQYQITLTRLRQLNQAVAVEDRVPRCR